MLVSYLEMVAYFRSTEAAFPKRANFGQCCRETSGHIVRKRWHLALKPEMDGESLVTK